jgi:hypothetical protein
MAQDNFNTTFRWVPAHNIQGSWYISPEGDMCKAARLPDGSLLVVRNHKPGFWLGPEHEFEAIFKPFVSSAPSARF